VERSEDKVIGGLAFVMVSEKAERKEKLTHTDAGPHCPFAVEPVTNIMLPDGIFDNALYNLRIACHYTNLSNAPLTNVSIYLESGRSRHRAGSKDLRFTAIPAGASVQVMGRRFQERDPGQTARELRSQGRRFRLAPHHSADLCFRLDSTAPQTPMTYRRGRDAYCL
jgi:hypothetical protein